MRVVEVPSGDLVPCDLGEMAEELTCAPIVTETPGRSFYTRNGFDYYVIVDSSNGESGEFAFQMKTGWQETGTACLDSAEPEAIVLGSGGVYAWSATLGDGHGIIGSGGACNAPGVEHIFPLQVLEAGSFNVVAQSTNGGPAPTLSLRTSGCGGANQLACVEGLEGTNTSQLDRWFDGPTNWWLVVDNPGDEALSYTFEAWLN
jgi:hypothetical protein